jgi:hypothetical protein
LRRAGCAPGLSVIDVGGGASHLAASLLDAGVTDVAVLDISENALARAKTALGPRASGFTWIVSDAVAQVRCVGSGLPVARYDAAGLAGELGPGYRLLESRTEAHLAPAGAVQHF